MLGNTNIYVVAREAQGDAIDSELHEYRRQQLRWTLMVETHPVLGLGQSEVVEYCVTWDEEAGDHQIHQLELGCHDSIIGSILVSDSSPIKHAQVASDLKQYREKKTLALDADSTSEDWLVHVFRHWQDVNVLDSFDLNTFMTFAHTYMANRQSGDSNVPATIAYPQLHDDHEKKAKRHGFWVSYPQSASNRSGERIYGGLM